MVNSPGGLRCRAHRGQGAHFAQVSASGSATGRCRWLSVYLSHHNTTGGEGKRALASRHRLGHHLAPVRLATPGYAPCISKLWASGLGRTWPVAGGVLGGRHGGQWETPTIWSSFRMLVAANNCFRCFSATRRGTAARIPIGPSFSHNYGKWRHMPQGTVTATVVTSLRRYYPERFAASAI
jgi:hypothetical protein